MVARIPKRWSVAAVVSAVLLGQPIHAEQPGDEPAPLFNPFSVNPQPLAGLGVGAGAGPGLATFRSLGVIYAGTVPEVRAWTLEGPLSNRFGRATLGTVTLVGLGGLPYATLATARAGDHLDCWRLVNSDEVRKVPASVLEWVQDGKGIQVGTLDLEAYIEFLVLASQTSPAAFAKAARHDLVYWHLFENPKKYRGEVVEFAGRLKRLRRFDPPEEAVARGVRDLYEGWMFDPELYGANPICIVFTDLPPGLKLGEKIDRRVSFAGYFFKKFRYNASDESRTLHDAPLVVGRSVTVLSSPDAGEKGEGGADWVRHLLPLFLSLVGGTLIGVIALTLWFRRADRKVQRRIDAVRQNREFVPPPPDEGPV
jgi:hypothetical protein